MDDIKLKKIDEPMEKQLPIGIHLITFDNHFVFVRRFAGRFVPVSAQEHQELCQQFLP